MEQKAKVKSVKFNMIMNAILTMSNIIFPLITFPYATRILLPAGMGKISFVTSVVAYFSMFAQLGIPMEMMGIAIALGTILDYPGTACNVSSWQLNLINVADSLGMLDKEVLQKDN